MVRKIRIAVLASGRGSNFEAIINAIKSGTCNAQISLLITNNPDSGAAQIAIKNGIKVENVIKSDFKKREDLDLKIKSLLDENKVELVVLAGYMLLIKNKELLQSYKNRIINIHPSLLPAFPGENAQEQAFNYGSKISGFTIHFVDQTLDGGAIIYQESVDISNCKNAQEVCDLILEHEHTGYPYVIDLFSKGKFEINGRFVRFIKG